MRFRLGIGGQGQQQSPWDSFGQGVQSLFSAPMARALGQEQAQTAGMRQHLTEAQIADHVAQAALHQREGDALGSAPDVLDTVIAQGAGTDVPTVRRWRETMMRGAGNVPGNAPPVSVLPGEMPPTPPDAPPAIDPKVAQALGLQYGRMAPAYINPKGFKVDDLAQASGMYQKQDAVNTIAADPTRAPSYGQAYAAIDGKPLMDNVGNTGVGFNKFTGQGNVIDNGLRVLFGKEGEALAHERNARAGEAGASASLANARRDRVVGGYGNAPVTVIDEDTGDASVTRLPTGQDPVTIGVAPSKKTGVDATQTKERNRVVTAVEKELIGATDAEVQKEVDRRMARRPAPGKTAPAAAPVTAPSAGPDMGKANQVKADVRAGRLTRDQGIAQLRALGFK